MSLQSLFTPIDIGGLHLTNRFVMAPMSRYACPDGNPTDDLAAYHRRRAESGVGMMLTGGVAIDHPDANNSPLLADLRPSALPAWKNLVTGVHEAGGLIAAQLWHAGAWFNREAWWHPEPLKSPSGHNGKGKTVGEPLTDAEIDDILASYRRAGAAARDAGFDAVEIHGAHGFLIDQFFWSETNRRTDRWGGPTLADRLEFGLEVYRAVRAGVGPSTPISMRISQWKEQEYNTRLAETPDELRSWVEPFAAAGVTLFSCSQRRFWDAEFAGSDLNLAGWVKKLTGVHTMTVGSVGLNTDVTASFRGESAAPARLDELVRRFDRGDFDLVAVGRALLADPLWVQKVSENRIGELSVFDAKMANVVY